MPYKKIYYDAKDYNEIFLLDILFRCLAWKGKLLCLSTEFSQNAETRTSIYYAKENIGCVEEKNLNGTM